MTVSRVRFDPNEIYDVEQKPGTVEQEHGSEADIEDDEMRKTMKILIAYKRESFEEQRNILKHLVN